MQYKTFIVEKNSLMLFAYEIIKRYFVIHKPQKQSKIKNTKL